VLTFARPFERETSDVAKNANETDDDEGELE
jgi:hypothetical protein